MLKYFLTNYYGYYIIYIFLIVAIVFSECSNSKKIKRKTSMFIFGLMIFFIIFRFDMEFDYVWYWIVGDNRFQNFILYESGYKRIEGFFKLVYQITRLLNNPKYFFIITGSFFSYFFFNSIKKYSKDKLFTLSIYYYIPGLYFSFLVGFIRQGLACVIYLFFMEKLKQRKYFYYSVIMFFNGILVHKSALIVLLLIPIHYYYTKKRGKVILVEIITFILLLNIEVVLKITPFLKKYTFYIYNRGYTFLAYKSIIFIFILYLVMITLIKLSKQRLNEDEKFQKHVINLGFLLFIVLSIKIGGHVPMRTTVYFFVFFPILFTNIINKLKNKKSIIIFISGCLFIIASLNLLKIVNNEYKNLGGRASYNYKLLFFYDYNDLNGKYIPGGKVNIKIRE